MKCFVHTGPFASIGSIMLVNLNPSIKCFLECIWKIKKAEHCSVNISKETIVYNIV